MQPVDEGPVAARRGFIGDCHAQPLGPRQVLIVREESLDGLGVKPWQVRANVATRGLPAEALDAGKILRLGPEVRVRVTHVCEVCKVLREYVQPEVFKALPGRRGYLGVFLSGGKVSVGDRVQPETDQYPPIPERIYDRFAWVVERIPEGRVVTSDTLLTLVGIQRAYFRVLPTYLRRAAAAGLPAHRVLTSSGAIVRHLPEQATMLRAEGVNVTVRGDVPESRWDGRELYFAAQ
jgi:alkylated DNA nucleotide flippase Atl1